MINKVKPEKLEHRMFKKFEYAITSGYKYIHFPIISAGTKSVYDNGDHWTLLVLDIVDGHWKYFNSLKPRTNETEDLYFKDAELLIDWIKSFILKRMSCYKLLNTLAHKSNNVIQMKNIPKQNGTVDCGFIVLYLMTCYAEGIQIPTRIAQGTMKAFKQRILEAMMNSQFATKIDEEKEKDYETISDIIEDLSKYSTKDLYGGNEASHS